MLRAEPSEAAAVQQLTRLVYELLDAHEDTMLLAAELIGEPRWAAHMDYMRGLQRVGREMLAAIAVSPS